MAENPVNPEGTGASAPGVFEHDLIVVESFLDHVKGTIITDAQKIKEILESEWSVHVMKKAKPLPGKEA